MSFKAKFSAGNIKGNVLACSFSLHQDIDATGRPASITRGGTISISVESTGATDLFEWMCNSFERKDGSIVFLKRDSDATLKELKFTEGYIVGYNESFTSIGTDPFSIDFTISCREMALGNGKITNEWV